LSRRVEERIDAIIQPHEKMLRFTSGMSRTQFFGQDLVMDAVLRNIEIIGEAAKHLPNEVRIRMPKSSGRKSPGCGTESRTCTTGLMTRSSGTRSRRRCRNSCGRSRTSRTRTSHEREDEAGTDLDRHGRPPPGGAPHPLRRPREVVPRCAEGTGVPGTPRASRGDQTQLRGIPLETGFCRLRILPSNARTVVAPVSRWRIALRVHWRLSAPSVHWRLLAPSHWRVLRTFLSGWVRAVSPCEP
jgi:hypothetical protein